ncbi:zinc finger matrin-type protein 4 isoform X8 [Columba livia]|uniref:zinc finger matrin-type protein 4 isoform X8 n=1 Tax=Columba livia TaxID=8932 RepID=UPI0031BACAB4
MGKALSAGSAAPRAARQKPQEQDGIEHPLLRKHEILRRRPGAVHRELLQGVQRSAHLRVPARGPLREPSLGSLKPHADGPAAVPAPHPRRDSDRYCQLCAAWFNNPLMAQQHYDGKKHKKNAARADLLEQLGKTLDLGELRGLKRSYTCSVCSVTLNSIEQYHAHLKGSKHQTKEPARRSQKQLSAATSRWRSAGMSRWAGGDTAP